jgi:hypothetical protein
MSVLSDHHNALGQRLREYVTPNDLAFIVTLLLITIVIGVAMFAPSSFFVR